MAAQPGEQETFTHILYTSDTHVHKVN